MTPDEYHKLNAASYPKVKWEDIPLSYKADQFYPMILPWAVMAPYGLPMSTAAAMATTFIPAFGDYENITIRPYVRYYNSLKADRAKNYADDYLNNYNPLQR